MLFSIIIPVYNVEPYLRACLDSLLGQKDSDWECICVDDGSSDASADILAEYLRYDSRFIVTHQGNQGVAVARNKALDLARGEWIIFLDADDGLHKDTLEHLRFIIESEDPDLIRYKFTRFIDRPGEQAVAASDKYSKIEGGAATRRWSLETLTSGGYCCLSVLRREKIKGRFPIGVAYAEDSLFLLRYASEIDSVVQSEFAGYLYRQVANSAMKRSLASSERLRFFKAFKEVCQLYKVQHPKLSWMAWFNLLSYLQRPKDFVESEAIRKCFVSLMKERMILLRQMPIYARPIVFAFCYLRSWNLARLLLRLVLGTSRLMRRCKR